MKNKIIATAGVIALLAAKSNADDIIYNTTYPDHWDGYGLQGLGIAVQFNTMNDTHLTSVTWEGALKADSSVPLYLYGDNAGKIGDAINYLGDATLAKATGTYGDQSVTFTTDIMVNPNTEYWIFANPNQLNTGAGSAWTSIFSSLNLPGIVLPPGQETFFINASGSSYSNTGVNQEDFHLQVTGTSPVPEPSTCGMLIAGAWLLNASRRGQFCRKMV